MPLTIPVGPPATDLAPGSPIVLPPGVPIVEFGGELANYLVAHRGGQVLQFAVQLLALL